MDFVTGGTGIVGRELLYQLLSRGREVKALRRPKSDIEGTESQIISRGASIQKLTWVHGDTRDYDEISNALEGCTRVFHLAALVSFHPSAEPKLLEINRDGTANIVNAMLEKGVKDLIYMSSVAALGHSLNEPITEKTEFEESPLVTGYSRSKYLSELEVWRGQEEGLNVLILNPSIIISEGDFSRSSGELFSQSAQGVPVYPAGTNGFVSARDVAIISVELANSETRGERFILNAENLSYKEAMTLISHSVGAKPPSKVVKNWMINLVVFVFKAREFFTGRKLIANKTSMLLSQLDTEYDGTKVQGVLHDFQYESINEAIERTGKSYLELS